MGAILFDLDGTLLPMRFEDFLPRYLGLLGKSFAEMVPGLQIAAPLMASTQAMMTNDGLRTNEAAFWEDFGPRVNMTREEMAPLATQFYRRDFPALGADIVCDPAAATLVAACRARGLKVALATNPVFPRLAIEERVRWAGLDPAHFDLITSIENMRSCKPRRSYFQQIADDLGVPASECLMIGNDVAQDLAPAAQVGMRTCLVENAYQILADGFIPDHRSVLAEVAALLGD